jgi:hypothetical protein
MPSRIPWAFVAFVVETCSARDVLGKGAFTVQIWPRELFLLDVLMPSDQP